MFSILIVEDSSDKLRNILQTLEKIKGIDVDQIDTEIDAFSAKKKLKDRFYDLLILDIAIPQRKAENVDPRGGVKLLDEITKRDNFFTPAHIIGMTAYEDVLNDVRERFAESLLTIISYSNTNIEWENKLKAGVKQRLESKVASSAVQPDYDFDVGIVCALESELGANRNNGWEWTVLDVSNDDTVYYTASFQSSEGNLKRVVAAAAPRMGMPATAALAMKVINQFRPKFLVMTGIMAGVTGRVELGDLVIANPTWDWGSGKWVSKEEENSNESLFLVDPYQFTIDPFISKKIKALVESDNFLFNLRKGYGKGAPRHDLNVHEGAVASGASVLSDKETFNKIKEQHRKLLGVEMEAYGLFSAVEIASRPKPSAVCIKSVVDFGDSQKSDDYQSYGTYVSASFAKRLIESFFENTI